MELLLPIPRLLPLGLTSMLNVIITNLLAKVLSRFNNIILARVFGHADVVELAEFATVPGQLILFAIKAIDA